MDENNYYYSCAYCGEFYPSIWCNMKSSTATPHTRLKYCFSCKNDIKLIKSKHECDYYLDRAEESYGRKIGITDVAKSIFLEEEVKTNPLYNEESVERRKEHEYNRTLRNAFRNTVDTNKPKCPTCGSTNIKKISSASKVAGAALFGLFSKTARSQFCCGNCGYKW